MGEEKGRGMRELGGGERGRREVRQGWDREKIRKTNGEGERGWEEYVSK